MKQRDSLRGKFYHSEASLDDGIVFGSIEDIQAYVDKLLATRWWKFRYPTAKVVYVDEGKSSLYALAYSDWDEIDHIDLPRFAWNEIYVIHELSHVAARHAEGMLGDVLSTWADHGLEFVHIYLEMVTYRLGRDVSRQLKDAFDSFGISWKNHLTSALPST